MNNKNPLLEKRQWHMLLIYNIYRVMCIAVFVIALWFISATNTYPLFYLGGLAIYSILALSLFIFFQIKKTSFQHQILVCGIIDIFLVIYLIYLIGFVKTGIGFLLYVYVAILSIIAPGQLAIFFASLASFMLLLTNALVYYNSTEQDLSLIFYTGVYGAGFFGTALTAWYLANWVRSNEELAEKRGRELASLHQLNEYIVANIKYGVIYVDSNQVIKIINDAACQYLKIESCLSTQTVQALSSELNAKYKKFLNHTNKNQQNMVGQTTLNNLQIRFYASNEADNQTAVLIIINDMAEIAQQAQQMKLASLGFFSASIAHELRNPLGAISHACQLLEDDDLDKEQVRLKEVIINNSDRMNQIIKNVLQISRSEKSFPEQIDLHEFLNQFRKGFCGVNDCKLFIALPRDNRKVLFDRSQLEQVLIILCENAMQHGRDIQTGETIITIKVLDESNKAILTFCDNGSGIHSEHIKNIFDPFYTTLTSGNGMGLFLAKDLCAMNQAQLDLIEGQKGACFSIQFNFQEEVIL